MRRPHFSLGTSELYSFDVCAVPLLGASWVEHSNNALQRLPHVALRAPRSLALAHDVRVRGLEDRLCDLLLDRHVSGGVRDAFRDGALRNCTPACTHTPPPFRTRCAPLCVRARCAVAPAIATVFADSRMRLTVGNTRPSARSDGKTESASVCAPPTTTSTARGRSAQRTVALRTDTPSRRRRTSCP